MWWENCHRLQVKWICCDIYIKHAWTLNQKLVRTLPPSNELKLFQLHFLAFYCLMEILRLHLWIIHFDNWSIFEELNKLKHSQSFISSYADCKRKTLFAFWHSKKRRLNWEILWLLNSIVWFKIIIKTAKTEMFSTCIKFPLSLNEQIRNLMNRRCYSNDAIFTSTLETSFWITDLNFLHQNDFE